MSAFKYMNTRALLTSHCALGSLLSPLYSIKTLHNGWLVIIAYSNIQKLGEPVYYIISKFKENTKE